MVIGGRRKELRVARLGVLLARSLTKLTASSTGGRDQKQRDLRRDGVDYWRVSVVPLASTMRPVHVSLTLANVMFAHVASHVSAYTADSPMHGICTPVAEVLVIVTLGLA